MEVLALAVDQEPEMLSLFALDSAVVVLDLVDRDALDLHEDVSHLHFSEPCR